MAHITKRIGLPTPTMHGDEMKFIQEAFDKNWIAPLGFNCDGFEEEIVQYLDGDGAVGLHGLCLVSGTSALHLAIKLAGVKRGDRVFCSDMTFAATANPIVYEGGIPVFIDSERETWNMDPVALEKAFEKYPDTKVVMLAHLYGTPAKMDEILAICEKYGAVLIEDAAEALGASYKGRMCGTFGEYNAISFNGNKIITTSGGGMLLTPSKKARDKALFWATQSREKTIWYQHEEIGYNYRMSNVLAGIGRGQLMHIDEHLMHKERIYRHYENGLKAVAVTMNPYLEDSTSNFWLSCLLVDKEAKVDPLYILNILADNNIDSRPIWKPMHMQPVFSECDFIYAEDTPVDEDIYARGLCLPSDIKTTNDELDFVIEKIKFCFEIGF